MESCRRIARLAAIALMGAATLAPAEEPCEKNHYILRALDGCPDSQVADPQVARALHAATLLRDGRVLVTGGIGGYARQDASDPEGGRQPVATANAEIYDPSTNKWRHTASMGRARMTHAATLLDDGRVLVVGGDGVALEPDSPWAKVAEVFDPATETWSPTGRMNGTSGCWLSTASRMPDGKVVVAGGIDFDGLFCRPEVYDAETGLWTPTGTVGALRYAHAAAALPDGSLLVAGGMDDDVNGNRTNASERYDPRADQWTPAGAGRWARTYHTATPLGDGRIFVAGGEWPAAHEVYDSARGEWILVSETQKSRTWHTATLLADGTVFLAGGGSYEGQMGSLRWSVLGDTERWLAPGEGRPVVGRLRVARNQHTATRLLDGSVILVGGRGADERTLLRSAERFVLPAPSR